MHANLSSCRDSEGGKGMSFDIFIAGIGGQGTILLSNISEVVPEQLRVKHYLMRSMAQVAEQPVFMLKVQSFML